MVSWENVEVKVEVVNGRLAVLSSPAQPRSQPVRTIKAFEFSFSQLNVHSSMCFQWTARAPAPSCEAGLRRKRWRVARCSRRPTEP